MRWIWLGCVVWCCAPVVCADEDKWTFGLGLGNQTLADYRGSAYYKTQFSPIPFVMYRGEKLKIDRDGMRSDIWRSDRVEFNISVDAALHLRSSDNPLREGMPELGTALEIGPSLNIRLSGDDFQAGWSLRLPVRMANSFSSDGVTPIGFLWSPKLTWKQAAVKNAWQTTLNFGPIFADADYHQYYYGVDPDFATAQRGIYEAKAGYSGSFAKISAKRQWHQWWLASNLRYDYLGGASFLDSPMLEEKSSVTVSVAVVRLLDF